MSNVTAALLGGALIGLGLFALGRFLFPSKPGVAARLSALDARRHDSQARVSVVTTDEVVSPLRQRVGDAVAAFYTARGWEQRSVKADLALLGKSFEGFLATKALLGASGLLAAPIIAGWVSLIGVSVNLTVPLWSALVIAGIFFMLPDLQIKRDAAVKRRDFRHVVGAFLDLVAMNLAGGRGVPEALMMASSLGHSWAMVRIRDALSTARIVGITPWQALGQLGEEVNLDELRDLSAALGLVAEDGAKVRQSLAARAETMRRRELAEIEGEAGERSQSMLVAQLLLCAGFLVFLSFPAAMKMLGL
ncbi:type II secretion system F family protein [Planotetraspora kaengkrachanensis]|uniref:Type II secretion system protein n=1 Tax=Planotetraspora kaengkrachanensis TaxID=575193 RepID=A0A8J3Q1X7_9ACTN|nr:type II secretion system F family protein [Planotetraspora kaengkrachanensis]GIG84996.1 type II secretion system protein [Planotetraspora kaengkrachanensis]